MYSCRSFTSWALAAALLGTSACGPTAILAQQPFHYYPAYGAHRGRMSYHQGPFGGTRQRIHWGGGLTDNGAAFLTSAMNAAVPFLTTALGREVIQEDEASLQRSAEFQRSLDDDRLKLDEARQGAANAKDLLAQFRGSAVQGPASVNGSQPAGNFGDWDSDTPGGPPQVAPPQVAPPQGNPPATGSQSDRFRDWDSESPASAPMGGLPASGSRSNLFTDWDSERASISSLGFAPRDEFRDWDNP